MSQSISKERLNLSFWMRIFKEHALFIKRGLTCDRTDLIEEAEFFYDTFDQLQARAESTGSLTDNDGLLQESITTTKELLDFKKEILRILIQCENIFNLYPLLINHTIREAEEFISLATIYCNNKLKFPQIILAEEIFWLRGMKDHTNFILHLLDPSELTFLAKTRKFKRKFTKLYCQALDLESMLQSNPDTFPKIPYFTNKIIAETEELYYFKEELRQLLNECKILSITVPLFADHTVRETDHFLVVIEQIKKHFQIK
ncbi:DUF2935 domain-containing protein [Sporohalobacter salinus]|uniref:DUF2935 domain-containing protein n=1 Tax=Sporohalobacter salinus TaxID=1494606 RepID=UPI001960119F|nr:DUF2935 domain-containing protein [Sporohalobacter salinus]MBM7622475.1 hypothetical protein [Sporohalobacter salinus]